MPPSISILDFASCLTVFLLSLSAHEAAHAWTARKLGDSTGYLAGQATLDPTPHIKREPFGMLVMPIISYLSAGWMIGWASVPFNVTWAEKNPRRAVVMAIAGPVANLVIAAACWCLLKIGLAAGLFLPSAYPKFSEMVISPEMGLPHLAAILLSLGFSLNLVLGVFNLLPFPPLDGSSLPLLWLSTSSAAKYQRLSRSRLPILLGLVAAWYVFPWICRPFVFWLATILKG
jgi:Zn-dependent protease